MILTITELVCVRDHMDVVCTDTSFQMEVLVNNTKQISRESQSNRGKHNIQPVIQYLAFSLQVIIKF